MSAATPFIAPQLRRENADARQEKVDPRSARNLLEKAFKRNCEALATPQKLQMDHRQALLETPIGRDFNLITTAGVEFKVHSVMLLGGSKVFQEGLFPSGAKHPNPPEVVNLPAHFYPILVDRIVSFIYTCDYHCGSGNIGIGQKRKHIRFHHATLLPDVDADTSAMTALTGIHDYMFHLRMYALAEDLQWDTLKSAAHAKLYNTAIAQTGRPTSMLVELVKATFAPLGDAARLCKDEDGVLQQLVVVAVLIHETRYWEEDARKAFAESIEGSEYEGFRNAYDLVIRENQDLLNVGDMVKDLAAARKATIAQRRKARSVSGGVNKSNGLPSTGSPKQSLMKARKESKTQFKKKFEPRSAAQAKDSGDVDADMELD